jgi:nitrogen regulatory protein P-II 1
MQLITAIVAPSKVDTILRGLRLFGVLGWTLSRVYLSGQPCVRLDLVAPNADTPDLARLIARAATGGPVAARRAAQVTPACLWITPLDAVTRIRTGERGPDAVS